MGGFLGSDGFLGDDTPSVFGNLTATAVNLPGSTTLTGNSGFVTAAGFIATTNASGLRVTNGCAIGVFAGSVCSIQTDGTATEIKMLSGADTRSIRINGTGIGFFGSAPVARSAQYTVTNPTSDRALNVTADTLAQGLAVLGTLIADLQLLGLIGP